MIAHEIEQVARRAFFITWRPWPADYRIRQMIYYYGAVNVPPKESHWFADAFDQAVPPWDIRDKIEIQYAHTEAGP